MRRTLHLVIALTLLLACPARSWAQAQIGPSPKYTGVARALEDWLNREVRAKGLPGLSIALVDDQEIVWSRGFGYEDPDARQPATADTVYRVGSVSKPVTALALMLLVQMGLIDLDVPVTRYLPDFQPVNPYDKKITLRQILSHRSGLVRESPVGNYFDASNPSLEKMAKSLNGLKLVFPPEQRTSYSNAGVSLAGYLLERTQKEPFAKHMDRVLLGPIGMKHSGYDLTPELQKHLAKATMWTYHGREFAAPTFAMGTKPAGNLYSSANDMGKLLKFLFAGGRTVDGKQLLKRETLESMWVPQFVKPGEKTGFGISFFISEFEGHKRISHGGAIYGFATEFEALPKEKLGVVVIASKDVANALTRRAAEEALRLMLAVRAGKPLPKIEETQPLDPARVRQLTGRYEADGKAVELRESFGRLYLWPLSGGTRAEVRAAGKRLITDDLTSYGTEVALDGDRLRVGKDTYHSVKMARPKPAPEKWRGLIGEYGWDHNTLFILELDGKLYALIEWFFLYPLREESENIYSFPNFGLYPGEKLIFQPGANGKATSVEAASVHFARRTIDGEDGKTFRIQPARPLDELRREALAAKPPREKGRFRAPDLVEVTALDPTIKLDIRYATTNNFLGIPFYRSAKAYLQRPAAEALVRVHKKLAEEGYGLLIHDGYRPWYVTKMFWEATPVKYRMFVADPAKGSRHNRGCAVDLTLVDLKTGRAVEMVGGYDEFSDRSYADYMGGTSLQRWHRDLLRRAMAAEGFTVYEAEWWHFDFRDWQAYGIGNRTFEEIAGGKR